jgi:molecular chaperone HscB
MSTERSTVPAKCMKCKAHLDFPIVCTGCQALYPRPQTADYFDLLGLERRYAVEETRLDAVSRALARNVHPDRFAGQPEEVRTLAIRLSAEVNQAIDVLRDPVRRAGYMLELAGGPSATEVRDVPPELLTDVMTLREQIEEARSSGHRDTLEHLRATINTRRAEILKRIAERADQLATSDDESKQEVRRLLNSVKYYDNLLKDLAVDPLASASGNQDD